VGGRGRPLRGRLHRLGRRRRRARRHGSRERGRRRRRQHRRPAPAPARRPRHRHRLRRARRWLQAQGATVVAYGDGLADRIRAAAPDGVTAFIDLFGPEYVRLAVKLGIPRDRINTVIALDAASELGTKTEGSAAGTSIAVLAELAAFAADGRIQVPIAATYLLDKVRDAFAELEERHALGKMVLIP
jgi:NADPH:quinone reductase-like Zn-dependent oxidoreductase